ncbi:hypothetical protein [Weissella halotolerans]|uniref:Uncharacterized protein n=1 Tax=Weissella halotolerans DSM 20190 TaxID=1123500 RepID=A0A0R2FYD1_9LACO|nr:hypothetical protein [Weissella halotolerans]KRN33458.1 hypothetical protein IV68_GL000260 [Weissella halotolerans DSM 20190]
MKSSEKLALALGSAVLILGIFITAYVSHQRSISNYVQQQQAATDAQQLQSTQMATQAVARLNDQQKIALALLQPAVANISSKSADELLNNLHTIQQLPGGMQDGAVTTVNATLLNNQVVTDAPEGTRTYGLDASYGPKMYATISGNTIYVFLGHDTQSFKSLNDKSNINLIKASLVELYQQYGDTDKFREFQNLVNIRKPVAMMQMNPKVAAAMVLLNVTQGSFDTANFHGKLRLVSLKPEENSQHYTQELSGFDGNKKIGIKYNATDVEFSSYDEETKQYKSAETIKMTDIFNRYGRERVQKIIDILPK